MHNPPEHDPGQPGSMQCPNADATALDPLRRVELLPAQPSDLVVAERMALQHIDGVGLGVQLACGLGLDELIACVGIRRGRRVDTPPDRELHTAHPPVGCDERDVDDVHLLLARQRKAVAHHGVGEVVTSEV
jgi:hypothetical protein